MEIVLPPSVRGTGDLQEHGRFPENLPLAAALPQSRCALQRTIPYTSKLAPTNSWFPIFPISGTQAAQFDYDLQRDSPLRYSS